MLIAQGVTPYNSRAIMLSSRPTACAILTPHAGVAQLVERLLPKQKVASSNLVSRSSPYTLAMAKDGKKPLKNASLDTLAVHAGESADPTTRAHNLPIYQTATFTFETADEKEAAVDGALA